LNNFDYWLVNINEKREYFCAYISTIQNCRNPGGKTTICDGTAFRHDGDETLFGDGRGDQSMSDTI